MNNKSSGLGCGLFFLLAIVIYVFQFITENPILWIVVLLVVVGLIFGVRASKRHKRDDIMAAFLATADKLDALAADQDGPQGITLTLRKGERALFAMHNAPLVEYTSSGSTYSGTNLGVSVPLFGSVRGNVGGSQGSFTKNPEELTIVDNGLVVFTTQRIVFTGAKLVRDWEFSKILNLDIGENGSSVRLAVSGNGRTSGFQSGPLEFGVGLPAGYAHTWFDEGEVAARAWLRRTAKSMREAVEALKQTEKNTGPVRPMDLDHTVQPKQVEHSPDSDKDDPASSK